MNLRRFATFSALAFATAPAAAQSTYWEHLATQWTHSGSQRIYTWDVDGDGAQDTLGARNGQARLTHGFDRMSYQATSIAQGWGGHVTAARLPAWVTPALHLAILVSSNSGLSSYDSTMQGTGYVPFPAGFTGPRSVLTIQADADADDEIAVSFSTGILLLDYSTGTPTWSTVVSGWPTTDGANKAYVRETPSGPRVGVCKLGAPHAVDEYDLQGNVYPVMPLPNDLWMVHDALMLDDDTLAVTGETLSVEGQLWLHRHSTNTSTMLFGGAPFVTYAGISRADPNGISNFVRRDSGVDEQVQQLDLATLQATPIIQASSGTGLKIASAPTMNLYPGHTPGFHIYRSNVGMHEWYSPTPVDTQTFDRLVQTGGTVTVDVRVPTTAAGGLVVPLFSFEVPQWLPTPFGTLAFTPDYATSLSIDLMGWQVAPANGALTFTMTVPSGPAGFVWPVSIGYLWFAPNGQTGGNQHGCTTSIWTQ